MLILRLGGFVVCVSGLVLGFAGWEDGGLVGGGFGLLLVLICKMIVLPIAT